MGTKAGIRTAKWVWLLAWRFLVSRGRPRFTHWLSLFSMGMVAVGSAALIVGLSAFNGVEELLRLHYSAFDPDLSIVTATGQPFTPSESLYEQLADHPGVVAYSGLLENYALLAHGHQQMVVRVLGIEASFLANAPLRDHVLQGSIELATAPQPGALIGRGVQKHLRISFLADANRQLQLFYPTDAKSFDLRQLYRSQQLEAVGVFAIHRPQDDNYVLVPLSVAHTLMGKTGHCNSIALRLRADSKPASVADALEQQLGQRYRVLPREEQRPALYRLLRIEKFFVFLAFSFILGIASLGLFFVLLMLWLEKRSDMGLLRALGARPWFCAAVFLSEGLLVSGLGCVLGLTGGVSLCLLQQRFAWITLGTDASAAPYPVALRMADFPLVGLCVVALTLLASLRPAWLAGRGALLPTSP